MRTLLACIGKNVTSRVVFCVYISQMQSSFPQFIHRCQNEVYKTYTEKYFHRKVRSSTVLFPIVSSTMGTPEV